MFMAKIVSLLWQCIQNTQLSDTCDILRILSSWCNRLQKYVQDNFYAHLTMIYAQDAYYQAQHFYDVHDAVSMVASGN